MIDLSIIINLNSNVKMRLLKNKWMVIAAMLLTLSVADAVAQPSIPVETDVVVIMEDRAAVIHPAIPYGVPSTTGFPVVMPTMMTYSIAIADRFASC